MALTRVRFATNGSGSGAYTVPINPTRVTIPRSDYSLKTAHPTLDGANVYVERGADNRLYELVWSGISHDKYSTMIANLVSYEFDPFSGNYKYLHLGDLGTKLGKFSSYTQVKVVGVELSYKEKGKFIVDQLRVMFEVV